MRTGDIRGFLISAVVMAVILMASCNSAPLELPTREYKAWMENPDNGWVNIKKMDGLYYMAKYKSPEYMALMEDDVGSHIDSLIMEIGEGMDYVDFRMGLRARTGDLISHGTRTEEEYNKRIIHMSMGMEGDFVMLQGGDTMRCAMYQFVRNYNLAPFTDFALAFEKNDNKGDKTLIYNDRIFGNGEIRMTFRESDLVSAPELKKR